MSKFFFTLIFCVLRDRESSRTIHEIYVFINIKDSFNNNVLLSSSPTADDPNFQHQILS